MKVKIVDIDSMDGYTQAGHRSVLIGRTGETNLPITEDGWTAGLITLDDPVDIGGETANPELYFWRVKVEPVKEVKQQEDDDVEVWLDSLWYHDKYVVVLFTCNVDEIIDNPGRYMTVCTVMINNKNSGEIVTHTGVAICNPKDTFNYVKGRRIATGRAISAYPHKEQRKLVWSWYWKAVKNVSQE